jgi:hypothetical protein
MSDVWLGGYDMTSNTFEGIVYQSLYKISWSCLAALGLVNIIVSQRSAA